MSERKRQRTVQRLEEIAPDAAVELRFRDGCQQEGFVHEVVQDLDSTVDIYYAATPPSADIEYGSKVDPKDWLPHVSVYDLGYVVIQGTGKKISCMPFQRPQ